MITDNTTYKGRTLGQWVEMAQRNEAEIVRLAGELSEKVGAPDLRSAPTDLSKRLRETARTPAAKIHFYSQIMHQAADEIERYYGGMMNWKANAQQKDVQMAEYRAALASAAPVEAAAPGGALNDALLRCCADLPDGYAIVVNVERGCGMVTYIDPDGDEFDIEGEGHLSDDVTEAFDACVEDEARIMGGAK